MSEESLNLVWLHNSLNYRTFFIKGMNKTKTKLSLYLFNRKPVTAFKNSRGSPQGTVHTLVQCKVPHFSLGTFITTCKRATWRHNEEGDGRETHHREQLRTHLSWLMTQTHARSWWFALHPGWKDDSWSALTGVNPVRTFSHNILLLAKEHPIMWAGEQEEDFRKRLSLQRRACPIIMFSSKSVWYP